MFVIVNEVRYDTNQLVQEYLDFGLGSELYLSFRDLLNHCVKLPRDLECELFDLLLVSPDLTCCYTLSYA